MLGERFLDDDWFGECDMEEVVFGEWCIVVLVVLLFGLFLGELVCWGLRWLWRLLLMGVWFLDGDVLWLMLWEIFFWLRLWWVGGLWFWFLLICFLYLSNRWNMMLLLVNEVLLCIEKLILGLLLKILRYVEKNF